MKVYHTKMNKIHFTFVLKFIILVKTYKIKRNTIKILEVM